MQHWFAVGMRGLQQLRLLLSRTSAGSIRNEIRPESIEVWLRAGCYARTISRPTWLLAALSHRLFRSQLYIWSLYLMIKRQS